MSEKTPSRRRTILNSADIDRVLTRIAHEILESNRGSDRLILMGIAHKGIPLAHRLGQKIAASDAQFDPKQSVGQLDVTMYRDDLRNNPGRSLVLTQLPNQGLDGKNLLLVDDVLYSGRTVRAALDALNGLGRPALVRLAVLIDRGHRQLPIRADHVGKNLPTSSLEKVVVSLEESHSPQDRVEIVQHEEADQ
ncbi:MAG: bifunctional pyr operon transcriptional regulator/uracil phosphoribosyltransferase PyrR [Rothia sp. (in: high G+C Gram-positive bacteria)]|nr:bifunctional pyr operon transcriptional regulator/uracil phosphoribosyltransferase PyrR [Rothia sp. (in: high G+C Gram-positive bacteria)]